MAPAAHHQHHHYHQKPVTVTQIGHQGTHDVTSVYEVQAQTALVLDELHSLSLSATLIAMPPSAIAITPTSAISQTTTSNYPKPSPPTFAACSSVQNYRLLVLHWPAAFEMRCAKKLITAGITAAQRLPRWPAPEPGPQQQHCPELRLAAQAMWC